MAQVLLKGESGVMVGKETVWENLCVFGVTSWEDLSGTEAASR
jgi:hypothetical protein